MASKYRRKAWRQAGSVTAWQHRMPAYGVARQARYGSSVIVAANGAGIGVARSIISAGVAA